MSGRNVLQVGVRCQRSLSGNSSPRKRHLNVLRVKAVGTALVPVLQEQEKQSLRTQEGKTGVP